MTYLTLKPCCSLWASACTCLVNWYRVALPKQQCLKFNKTGRNLKPAMTWCISAGVRIWSLKTDGMSHNQSASYAQLASIFTFFLRNAFLSFWNLSYDSNPSSPAKNCQRKFSSDSCIISSVCFVCGRLCTCSAAKNCWSSGEENWKHSFSLWHNGFL